MKNINTDFLDINTISDKQLIIDKINEFINKYQYYAPIYEDNINNHIKDYFINYAKANNLKILNLNYFVKRMPSKLKGSWGWNGYANDFCVVRDSNGVNKIIIRRNNSLITTLSNRLGINTLKLFYQTFVLDVIDLKAQARFIKEIESLLNNLCFNKFFYKSNIQTLYIVKYTYINFDKKKFELTIKAQNCYVNMLDYNMEKNVFIEKTFKYNDIAEIYEKILEIIHNKDKFISNESDLTKSIMEKYQNIIESYENNLNCVINGINSIIS